MPDGRKRRAHLKSRLGCAECKRRRVKCDEARPRCRQCVRFEKDCVYKIFESGASPLPSLEASHPTLPTTPVSQSPNTNDLESSCSHDRGAALDTTLDAICPAFAMRDMAMLHHWTASTSITFANGDRAGFMWRDRVTQIGFRYPFVLYGLLSLAALHQAYLHPEHAQTRITDAAEYHNAAIRGFKDSLATITAEGDGSKLDDHGDLGVAVFVSAMLNTPYVFASEAVKLEATIDAEETSSRTARLLGSSWIPLNRAIPFFLRPVHERVRRGPLKDLTVLYLWEETDPDRMPSAEDPSLLSLTDTWVGCSEIDLIAYREALSIMRKNYAWYERLSELRTEDSLVPLYDQTWAAPFIWITTAPDRLFHLLQMRQPPALLMFAYFGALLDKTRHCWWVQDHGRDVVKLVEDLLGSYWQPWLKCPIHAVTERIVQRKKSSSSKSGNI